jgi:hypothetical protein
MFVPATALAVEIGMRRAGQLGETTRYGSADRPYGAGTCLACDVINTGSRKVIGANGGVLEDERDGKLRCWVPTAAAGARA